MAPEPGQWSPVEEWDQYEPPEAMLEADDERLTLRRRMDGLEPRERTILNLRYGLEGETPLTLKEIGRRLGVTREWVRKIELRAMRKLEESWESQPQTCGPHREAAPRHRRACSFSPAEPAEFSPVADRKSPKFRGCSNPVSRTARPAPSPVATP
jgi:DNA-binding CsgD family transcriptional regulator